MLPKDGRLCPQKREVEVINIDGNTVTLSNCPSKVWGASSVRRMESSRSLPMLLLFVAGILGVFLATSGYWTVWQSRIGDSTPLERPKIFTFADRRPLAAFTLVDDAKNIFDLKSLEGKWSFLFFGFMYCPDICPTTLYDLAQTRRDILAHGIPEEDLQFVFISVDPTRDKAEKIYPYVKYFDPSFLGTTGSIAQLTNITRQLGAPFRAGPETAENVYEVSHSSAIYLIDPFMQYTGIISAPIQKSAVAEQFANIYHNSKTTNVTVLR